MQRFRLSVVMDMARACSTCTKNYEMKCAHSCLVHEEPRGAVMCLSRLWRPGCMQQCKRAAHSRCVFCCGRRKRKAGTNTAQICHHKKVCIHDAKCLQMPVRKKRYDKNASYPVDHAPQIAFPPKPAT
eukprot:4329293-Pleurochrysis_carterae.AAC.7